MPPEKGRPVLNPVLRFTKEPRPESVTAGGKNAKSVRADRLAGQREHLARELKTLASVAEDQPKFTGASLFTLPCLTTSRHELDAQGLLRP